MLTTVKLPYITVILIVKPLSRNVVVNIIYNAELEGEIDI